MVSVTNFVLDEFDFGSIKTHIINAFRLPRIPHLSPEEEKLAIGKIKFQWGHEITVAETDMINNRDLQDIMSFNGATTLQSWKLM